MQTSGYGFRLPETGHWQSYSRGQKSVAHPTRLRLLLSLPTLSVLRQLMHFEVEISEFAFNTGYRDTDDLLEHAERLISNIVKQHHPKPGGFRAIRMVLAKSVDNIEALNESDSPMHGIETGFSELDKITSGLQSADLIIVAGRPSMGINSFAMNMAENIALQGKKIGRDIQHGYVS